MMENMSHCYIVLEQYGAAVDMIGHRLLPVKYMDEKPFPGRSNPVDTRTPRNRFATWKK